jgi:hypothetical protein
MLTFAGAVVQTFLLGPGWSGTEFGVPTWGLDAPVVGALIAVGVYWLWRFNIVRNREKATRLAAV